MGDSSRQAEFYKNSIETVITNAEIAIIIPLIPLCQFAAVEGSVIQEFVQLAGLAWPDIALPPHVELEPFLSRCCRWSN